MSDAKQSPRITNGRKKFQLDKLNLIDRNMPDLLIKSSLLKETI